MAQVSCSFCGRRKSEVDLLLSGIDAHICNHCITQGNQVVMEELNTKEKKDPKKSKLPKLNLIPPVAMKEFMEQYIIGQDEAKRSLAVAVYNHYKRLTQFSSDDEVVIEKSNIIMAGETGTGKSYLARTVAKILQVPF